MSDQATPPSGKRFTSVHLEKWEPLEDSGRARARIGHFLEARLRNYSVVQAVKETFGSGPARNLGDYNWKNYLTGLERRDFLDSIAVIHKAVNNQLNLYSSGGIADSTERELTDLSTNWVPFCREVFRQEGLAYRIDDLGGVRPLVDAEFQREKHELLRSLSDPRYVNARHHLEAVHDSFGESPPNTRAAIKSVFETVEVLFQLVVGKKLNRGNIASDLLKKVLDIYAADSPRAWIYTLRGWADWVDGMQLYRHVQGDQKSPRPSEAFAVYALSTGTAVARALLDIDKASKDSSKEVPPKRGSES